MILSDEMIRRARKLDRAAMQMVLAEAMPVVHRLSLALSGREDVGRGIERFVVGRALHVMDQWRDGDAAADWFYHHTVLTSRRAWRYSAETRADVLGGLDCEAAYLAFVRSIRSLSPQQREAVLLHHCEGLEQRGLARAMDCSIQAAQVHLRSAEETLRPMAGAEWQELMNELKKRYWAIELKGEGAPIIERMIRRHLLPRRIRRVFLWLLLGCAVGAAYFIYQRVAR
jgi:DNA-directed RNA polymerase specialized sigma24 family protein